MFSPTELPISLSDTSLTNYKNYVYMVAAESGDTSSSIITEQATAALLTVKEFDPFYS